LKMQKEALSIVDGSAENPPVVVTSENIADLNELGRVGAGTGANVKDFAASVAGNHGIFTNTFFDDSPVDGKSMLIAYNEGWNDAIDKISETMLASKPMQRDQFVESFNLLKK
jgi:hypothetical protein